MKQDEIMLKIENVSKIYKLGEIGGTTLREEFQRLHAKIHKKEDPTKKIGAKNYNKGERFKALDNISFEVKKGERIGIIGHNGAGKSTLLKLISRVTGPTEGNIYLNGRVASMLEVGTGFHPELTGRENVYMNGAILGMTKKEIDAKMEDIIEFSEVRQFIDTPVKRYSSGMYVKLAFSVAAHLDSEIMIMDEVLAVGDMAFQQKCLNKMKSVSEEEQKTLLYVSHNMNTIRQLCDRVVVLKKGKVVFDGDVEEGIKHYSDSNIVAAKTYDLTGFKRLSKYMSSFVLMRKVEILNQNTTITFGESLLLKLDSICNQSVDDVKYRFIIKRGDGNIVGTSHTDIGLSYIKNEEISHVFEINTESFAPGHFSITLEIFTPDGHGNITRHDYIRDGLQFDISDGYSIDNLKWSDSLGGIILPSAKIK